MNLDGPPMVDPTMLPLDNILVGSDHLLWPPGGQELALAAVVALALIVFFLAVHVVGQWGKR